MRDTSRGEWRFLRFIGGMVFGLVVSAAAVAALLLAMPAGEEEQAALEPAAPAAQEEQPLAAVSPEIAPSDPALPQPVPQPSASVNRQISGAIEPSPPPEDGRFSAPEPFETTVSDGQLSGLPPAATLEGPAPVVDVPQVESPAFQLQGPALTLNAARFEAVGNAALIAVVLNDAGASALSAETLLSLPVPLTLGIVPRSQQEIELAARTRLENDHYEVLAQLPIAAAGEAGTDALITPEMSDVEVAERVEDAMATLWMSIGASGLTEEGRAIDERIIRGVIAVLERNGFAFVNADAATAESGRAFAQAFSVAYAGQTRPVPADATADEVYALLEAAASEASATGPLIVSGPPTRAMLEGVLKWDIERGRRAAQIAPLSAVIRQINQS